MSNFDAIQDGDVLLWKDVKGFWSQLIRCWTDSPYSHAAIACWEEYESGDKLLCVIEAHEKVGVRKYPLELYLETAEEQGYAIEHCPIVTGKQWQHGCKGYQSSNV